MKKYLLSLFIFLFLVSICFLPASAQIDSDYGYTRVNLEGGHYFLVPDSYIRESSMPILSVFAAKGFFGFLNKLYGSFAVFGTVPLSEKEKEIGIRELGFESQLENGFFPKSYITITLSRVIEMNGRDVLFARGYYTQSNINFIMYEFYCDDYLYLSMYGADPNNFNSMYAQFFEIQNSFK